MSDILNLLFVAAAYRHATHLSEATVSTRLFNDGKRLAKLRGGEGDIGVKRLRAAFEWFSANWPENAAWPEGVTRPAPAKKAEDAA